MIFELILLIFVNAHLVTLYFPENGLTRELQFNFYSNSMESGRGFYIEYLQELCIGSNDKKYQTGIGHAYPSNNNDDNHLNQARSMQSSNQQQNSDHIVNDDPSIQQTISLREQKSSVYKKAPPTYPPGYIARSNPVGEMIEAIDHTDNQMSNNDQQTNRPKNYQSSSSPTSNLNYPTSYSNQMNLRNSSPLFDGRKSQTNNGKQIDHSDNARIGKQSDSQNHDQSKSNWSGNVQVVKPTVSGSAIASFLTKLKMGDQVMTSIKGRYEVIDNRNKAKRQSE